MNENKKGTIKNELKGRGLFYGVIAVATFIIMAVGATFAYFTATTNSTNSAVTTGSTTLKLKYISYQEAWMNNDLIPADYEVVEYSFENQNDTTAKVDGDNVANALCKDDFGNSICSVYVFQVINTANSPQEVSINVVSELNQFTNLSAMAYEVSVPTDDPDYNNVGGDDNNGMSDPNLGSKEDEGTNEGFVEVLNTEGIQIYTKENAGTGQEWYEAVFINRKGVQKTLLKYQGVNAEGQPALLPAIQKKLIKVETEVDKLADAKDRTVEIADNIEIAGGEMKTFALVLYIENQDTDQTDLDALKTFTGQVVVSSGDGSTGVSGTIGVVSDNLEGAKDNLQSNQQNQTEPEEGTE